MRALPIAAALMALLLIPGLARADGEAGLVIDWGDGRVSTHCVAFQGDSISGDELLSRAGYSVNDFSGLVCGIGGTGCTHSGTGSSCLCECPSGGSGCTYWAFFTRLAGSGAWQYSMLGYRSQQARHGDLHGWRWGQGSSGRAQPPPAISFDAICQAAPTATPVPPTATPIPPTPTPTPTGTPAPPPAPTTSSPAPTGEPTPTVTTAESPSPTPTATVPMTLLPASTPSPVGEPPTPSAPAAGSPSGGRGASLALFSVAAVALLAAIGGATVWRRRRGS